MPYCKSRQQEDNPLTDTKERNAHQHKALQLLANGFSDDFADFLTVDQRVIEVLHECVNDFVDEHIPLTDDQDKLDLSFLLLDKVIIKAWKG